MDAQLLQTIQETHLAIWNERDRSKRDKLIGQIYADDIKMYDRDFILQNKTEVSDFIDKIQSQDPDFYFSAVKPMEQIQNSVRLYWHIRLKKDQPLLNGMDFFLLENGKVAHLYVFMEMNK